MLDYEEFRNILNEALLKGGRVQLLQRMASNPERFIGLFRPTSSREKLLQNVLQSLEIRFGDAMERVLREWLTSKGYNMQPQRIESGLVCDLYFSSPDGGSTYLVEMKMRDDHDSSKRTGQWDNFAAKVKQLYELHDGKLTAIFYFLDPALTKNRRYYERQCQQLANQLQGVNIRVMYGRELFEYLSTGEDWTQLLEHLRTWKNQLQSSELLNMETEEALMEITQKLNIRVWRRIAQQDAFWDESFVRTLFPEGRGLEEIARRIQPKDHQLATTLREKIRKLYPHQDCP